MVGQPLCECSTHPLQLEPNAPKSFPTPVPCDKALLFSFIPIYQGQVGQVPSPQSRSLIPFHLDLEPEIIFSLPTPGIVSFSLHRTNLFLASCSEYLLYSISCFLLITTVTLVLCNLDIRVDAVVRTLFSLFLGPLISDSVTIAPTGELYSIRSRPLASERAN